jgi:hypothetical protein
MKHYYVAATSTFIVLEQERNLLGKFTTFKVLSTS